MIYTQCKMYGIVVLLWPGGDFAHHMRACFCELQIKRDLGYLIKVSVFDQKCKNL